jgi:hypothetical protein
MHHPGLRVRGNGVPARAPTRAAAYLLQQATLHDRSAQRHCSILKQASPPPDTLGATPRVPGGGMTGTVGLSSGGAFIGVGRLGTIFGSAGGILGAVVCAVACGPSTQERSRTIARSVGI